MTTINHSADTLVRLNYIIALIYCASAFSLVIATAFAFTYLTEKMQYAKPFLTAGCLFVLWMGVAMFLLGCAWHHSQHAHHLRIMGCEGDLCSVSAYASAYCQIIGGGTALLFATLLTFTPSLRGTKISYNRRKDDPK